MSPRRECGERGSWSGCRGSTRRSPARPEGDGPRPPRWIGPAGQRFRRVLVESGQALEQPALATAGQTGEPTPGANLHLGRLWKFARVGGLRPEIRSGEHEPKVRDRRGWLVPVVGAHDSDSPARGQMTGEQIHQPPLPGEIRQFRRQVEDFQHRIVAALETATRLLDGDGDVGGQGGREVVSGKREGWRAPFDKLRVSTRRSEGGS